MQKCQFCPYMSYYVIIYILLGASSQDYGFLLFHFDLFGDCGRLDSMLRDTNTLMNTWHGPCENPFPPLNSCFYVVYFIVIFFLFANDCLRECTMRTPNCPSVIDPSQTSPSALDTSVAVDKLQCPACIYIYIYSYIYI